MKSKNTIRATGNEFLIEILTNQL